MTTLLGRGTHRRRVAAESGNSDLIADRQTLYAQGPGTQRGPSSQRWMTFVRNHAQGILACDFFVTVTASFRVLYVFVVMEVGTRRIAHVNVTAHPTVDWTLRQFREVITGEKLYRFLVHNRDGIYSSAFDSAVEAMGLSILKTPFRAPQANAFCERLIGSIRRECLDFLIPLNHRHLRGILKEWVAHYNKGRPHSGWGKAYLNHQKIAQLALGAWRDEAACQQPVLQQLWIHRQSRTSLFRSGTCLRCRAFTSGCLVSRPLPSRTTFAVRKPDSSMAAVQQSHASVTSSR